MNHRRLTDLTAVLAGTAVFFTILDRRRHKKSRPGGVWDGTHCRCGLHGGVLL